MGHQSNTLLIGIILFFLNSPCFSQNRPNILLIVADDLGWADVGFNGGKDIPTPNLDAIAQHGVIFQAGYASHPYCSPSRAGLLTGRHQQRFGHENNTPYNQADPNAGLPLNEKLISEVLLAYNYKTAAIGKWHVGDDEKFWPTNRGFQEWYGFFGGGLSYWGDTGKKDPIHGVLRDGVPVPIAEQSYLTDDFSEEAVQFIQQTKEDPFFLYLAYNAPHAPIHATSQYLSQTDHIEDGHRSAYAAMVVGMDQGIGKIIQSLKDQDKYENTLIIFFSDNGGHLHGASNYPFRGHKGMLFEGGIRVPFILSWPGVVKNSQTYNPPISALDIFPTILAAAKVDFNSSKPIDGVNLLPFLSGNHKGEPHSILYWRYSDGLGYAVRKANYKLIQSGYKNTQLLFDLDTDPYEQNNLAVQMPSKVSELVEHYQEWNKELIPGKWSDPHPENIVKEETKRLNIRNNASKGEKKQ